MFKNGITGKRTAARTASAVALLAAAGILTAAVAAAPASAMSQLTRYWAGELVERHSVEMTAFESAATRAPVTGSQLTRYWSGQLTDRRQVLQNLALAESLAIHTGDDGGTPTIVAVESHPKFWADPLARR